MAASKGGGTRKGAAARAEKAQTTRKVEYRGIKLELPAELPPTLLFDITEIEAAGEDNPMPVFRMLRSLLGAEQFTAVRNEIGKAAADDDFTDIGDLMSAIFDQYGLSAGEAQASPAS